MDAIRAFVAIELTAEVKHALSAAQTQLASAVPAGAVRWVKPHAMHLTLRFLGQTDVRLLPQIGRAMDDALGTAASFSLLPGAFTIFPNASRPRTLVIGIDDAPSRSLAALRQQLDAALAPLGILADTKPFNPHLTLGRVRQGKSLGRLPSLTLPQMTFVVAAVHLIESDLRPEGPIYTTRHTTTLSPSP